MIWLVSRKVLLSVGLVFISQVANELNRQQCEGE